MLTIKYDSSVLWDDLKNEFIHISSGEVRLENSLIAISKWEEKFNKPFFHTKKKTTEELIYFIRCMGLTPKNDELLDNDTAILLATNHVYIKEIKEYLDSPKSATVVKNVTGRKSNEAVTSELIYYWLVAHQIDFEVQYWPIQRLIKLVEVCNAKNQPGKKMSKADNIRQHKSLNSARRKAK